MSRYSRFPPPPPLSPRRLRPCCWRVSLTSSIDFLPKFGIAASSFSVFMTRSPIVAMPTRFRQLYERTPTAIRQVGDLELRIQQLELRGSLDVPRRDRAGALGCDVHLDLGRLAFEPRDQVLEVQDDVGDVLTHTGQRRELVRSSLHLDRGDRGALERREQDAAQRVAERVTEAAVERLDDEDPPVLVHLLVDDLGDLKIDNACRQRNPSFLLGIKLDDELLLNGRVDVSALRLLQDLAREAVVVGLEPRRNGRDEIGRVADHLLRRRARRHGDDVVRANLVARDVHAPPVHLEMAVAHQLARLRARGSEAEAVDDVVQPRLEETQEFLTRDARAARRLLVVVAELLLEQAVVPARLLLLAQLEQVLALLDAAAAVLARRIRATLDRALLGETALALQEELHALTPADAALRPQVSRH